jgi:D-serine deaminase-like pyridoxal phosphate-dependent protein
MTDLFPELKLEPCLGILTRVISQTRPGCLTLDVGHKACAADQPFGQRLAFPEIPDALEVQHSEEHLVIETRIASRFSLGDPVIAIPRHVCPTTALFDFMDVVDAGRVVDRWMIEARKRQLTV